MASQVFWTELKANASDQELEDRLSRLCRAVGLEQIVAKNDLVAIKMHFGESGNTTHVQPQHVRPLIQQIQRLGGKPFLCDTTVLYKSDRSDAVSHLHLAHRHGFTIENVGAPVMILDGLTGDAEIEVPINGKVHGKVSLAREIFKAHAIVVVSHVTAHMNTGLGATLKNLGMGLASRRGKLRQHSGTKPEIRSVQCSACGECLEWCPEEAISWVDGKAWIDPKKCIGCGECLTVCNFDAVAYDWGVGSVDLQKSVAEHALGVVQRKREKMVYFNFVINVTKDCDCFGRSMRAICPDLGVLAGRDPVAVDTAAVDLLSERAGKPFRSLAYNHINETVQLQHGQKIGLGSMEYESISVS